MVLHIRFRDPRTGRFRRNDGRSKLVLEVWNAEENRLVERGKAKRYRLPSASEIIREEQLELTPVHRSKLTGRTVLDMLAEDKIMRKFSGKRVARLRVAFVDPVTKARVVFVRTIRLATTGKNKAAQNRSIILRTILALQQETGFRFYPKKYRKGASKRSPTARQVTVDFEAA